MSIAMLVRLNGFFRQALHHQPGAILDDLDQRAVLVLMAKLKTNQRM